MMTMLNATAPYIPDVLGAALDRCAVEGCKSAYKGPSGLFYHMKSIHPEVDYGGKK